MNEKEKGSKEWISIRVKPEDYNKIYHFYQTTTCRKFSEYIRMVLLRKPIKVNIRNQSLEELLVCMNQLKNELNSAGHNFDQAVVKLQQLVAVQEIKAWLLLNESSRQVLLKKTEEIRIYMKQIYEQWSQK